MSGIDHLDVHTFTFKNPGEYALTHIRAGIPDVELVEPPAGPEHTFYRYDYPVNVQVSVSPTGRSVQVWLNGERVYGGKP